jgi:hypothetical protein
MGQVVFALRPPGQQVEMLAGMLEVLLNWFRPPRPGPVSTPPGGERAGQDIETWSRLTSLTSSSSMFTTPLVLRHELGQWTRGEPFPSYVPKKVSDFLLLRSAERVVIE